MRATERQRRRQEHPFVIRHLALSADECGRMASTQRTKLVSPNTNECLGSTTCDGHARILSQVPKGTKRGASAARSFRLLPRRHWGDRLTIQVRYVGRAEPWVEVTARGVTKRYPGDVCLLHVLADVNNRLPYG